MGEGSLSGEEEGVVYGRWRCWGGLGSCSRGVGTHPAAAVAAATAAAAAAAAVSAATAVAAGSSQAYTGKWLAVGKMVPFQGWRSGDYELKPAVVPTVERNRSDSQLTYV